MAKKLLRFLFYKGAFFLLVGFLEAQATIQSLYGTVKIDTPLVEQILRSAPFNRLRFIDNAGPSFYFRSLPPYSLFDHAVGVYVILKRFGRPLEEQIAGLLEPIAHSVFSHQGTSYLRVQGSRQPYYLGGQKAFLKQTGLEKILNQSGLSGVSIDSTHPNFKALSKNPPDLSVLEIEMTLRLGFSYQLLTRPEISKIIEDLRFEQDQWFFVSQESAKKFANLSLYFAEHYWGAPITAVINKWVAEAIQRAVALKLLDPQILRFGQDQEVLKLLISFQDPIIRGRLLQCRQPFRFYKAVTQEPYDEFFKLEFRGLDPFVQVDGKLQRLSALDKEFKQEFQELEEVFKKGIKVLYRRPLRSKDVPNFGP